MLSCNVYQDLNDQAFHWFSFHWNFFWNCPWRKNFVFIFTIIHAGFLYIEIYIFDVTARSCEYFSFMNSDKSRIVVKTTFLIVSKKATRVGKSRKNCHRRKVTRIKTSKRDFFKNCKGVGNHSITTWT